MITKFKNILLKRTIKKKQLPSFVFSELKKVVFLINEGQDISLEIKVLKEGVSNPISIKKVIYVEQIEEDRIVMDTLFTSKDFNWYGKPKGELVNFLNESYDLVIDLTESKNEFYQKVLELVDSKIITGFKSLDIYSINLNIRNNNLLFIEELLRYLSTFKKPL